MRRLRIDMEDLALAFETASEEIQYFLDTDTGEIILQTEEEAERGKTPAEMASAEPGRYVPIPAQSTQEGYREMMHFIETVPSRELRELLKTASSGRWSFRRFKDVLARHPDDRQRWFTFKDARLQERAAEWLMELRIEPAEPGPD